jgi:general secretion pathway protein K
VSRRNQDERGAALLAVLWLCAVLAAIAFSVANTVRGETERTSTTTESVRAYYLATGGIERALAYIEWGPSHRNPDNTPRYFENGMARLNFRFPSGGVTVDVIPESSKYDINAIPPPELFRLLMYLGAEEPRAQQIVAAILDWRSPAPAQGVSVFDQQYLAGMPSFRARHASLEETEELLLVKGMTPEIYHGSYVRDAAGRLQPRAGLKDCVSVYGSAGPFDINTVQPAVLQTLGISPEMVAIIQQRRHASPFRNTSEIAPLAQFGGPGFARLTVGGGNTIFTLRSTARLSVGEGRYSDLTRTVSAIYKFHKAGYTPLIEVLRWYDNN